MRQYLNASIARLAPLSVLIAGCDFGEPARSRPDLIKGDAARVQVEAVEQAFARTMAERDFPAFQKLLSSEAIFFSGPAPLRGSAEVSEYWRRYFEGAQAPFSWKPDQVEVLASGELALSTGPVYDPEGRMIARFSSIWRQESRGTWRIVFDRGEAAATPSNAQ